MNDNNDGRLRLRATNYRYQSNVKDQSTPVGPIAISIQSWVRIAAILLVLTLVGGALGEAYVPSRLIVPGDPAATARTIMAHQGLFRAGFAFYLIEAFCDIGLAFIFYVLLRPVQKELALMAAFFGLASTAVYAVAELFYFAALIILRSGDVLKMFSPEQVSSLAFVSLRLFNYCGWIFLSFYGIPSILRGYLIFRSEYLPKFLGVLLIAGGAGFILKNFTTVLAPAYASNLLLLPMFLAIISLTIWFLVKGVDLRKWEAAAPGFARPRP